MISEVNSSTKRWATRQLGSLSYKKGANTLFSLSYGYAQPNGKNNNQITTITDNLTAANGLTFTYDALGRLINGKTANTTSPNTWDITWVYDRYGNRTSQTENAGTLPVTNANLTFNNNNQITGGFAYDASGNMTNDGITTNYVYDAENHFVKLGSTGGWPRLLTSLAPKTIVGAPSFAHFAKGGNLERMRDRVAQNVQKLCRQHRDPPWKDRCQGHRSQSEVEPRPRPCKKRKDGAPALISEVNSSTKRWATRHHDKCYYNCRQAYTCDPRGRQGCFEVCDAALGGDAHKLPRTAAGTAIDILMNVRSTDLWPFQPDPYPNAASCPK